MEFIGKQTTMGAGVFYNTDEGIPVDALLTTDGSGYWSGAKHEVKIVGLCLISFEGAEWGELRIYFDTNTWDTEKDGLIYGDSKFMEGLHSFLNTMKLPGSDVYYSEQGMQGDNYVSCDVESDFVRSFKALQA